MNGANGDRVELDWQKKRAAFYGQNALALMTALGVCLTVLGTAGLLTFAYMHQEDAKVGRGEFIAALKEQAAASRESAAASRDANVVQKEQVCLLGVKPEDRPQWADWCKKNSR